VSGTGRSLLFCPAYTAVTGTVSTRLKSLFPPGILIGTVNRVDEGEGELDRRIHVRPAADLRRLEYLEVLTKPNTDLLASTNRSP